MNILIIMLIVLKRIVIKLIQVNHNDNNNDTILNRNDIQTFATNVYLFFFFCNYKTMKTEIN